jgi:Fic family protein
MLRDTRRWELNRKMVPAEIEELLRVLEDLHGQDILKAVAFFHARFEYIHLFAGGMIV